MARVVVCGGSVIGQAVAMLLARDAHEVTVLERDPGGPPNTPDEAWEGWDRKGVPQFHQAHLVFPRFRMIVQEEFPELLDDMLAAGMVRQDFLDLMPPFITDRQAREGDDRFWYVTGRRPVIEYVFARAGAREPRVEVRRGVKVEGLVTGPSVTDGSPHVTGVRLADGEEIAADLVVDAMGRRTQLGDWLGAVGGRSPELRSEDCGFTYYTRYFTGPEPPAFVGPLLTPLGTFSALTLPGDNRTWSVTLFVSSGDRPLKELRHVEKWTKLVASLPLQVHWLDGEPITDILPMSGVLDRYRRFVVDGRPVATGVAAVGDAWACTNPSAGRGLSVGMIHAQLLRDVVRSSLDDPGTFANQWDAVTEAEVAPWYWTQIRADRARVAEMNALRNGTEPPPLDPTFAAVGAAMVHDPDVFRGVVETLACLALPEDVFTRPGFMDKVAAASSGEAFAMPGPSREELLTLVA